VQSAMCPSLDFPLPMAEPASESVAEIVRAHAGYVGRALRYLGVREADLDDACQEVFLVVRRRRFDTEGHATIRTWLYAICLRVARAARRQNASRREQPVETLPETAEPASQEHELEKKRARELLATLLDELDDDKRNVFVLFELEELSMQEVSRVLDCPLQTAYSRLSAARGQIKKAYRRRNLGRTP
jgi:RNA polymerase sigma-70 factor, ECF subfamily